MSEKEHSEEPYEADRRHRQRRSVRTGLVPTSQQTGNRITSAIGTYLVTMAGFVFTFFFVNTFVGDMAETVASSLFGGAGVILGFALAILLSPFVAVVVGQYIGRQNGTNEGVDAALGATTGFIVMFFVGLVLVAALGGSVASAGSNLVNAGALIGLAIGNGVTGAGAAVVARADSSLVPSVDPNSLASPITRGTLVFLVFGIGYAITILLAGALGPDEGAIGMQQLGIGTVSVVMGFSLLLAPLIAIITSWVIVDDDTVTSEQNGVVASGLASAVGIVVLLFVIYLAVVMFQPDAAGGGDFPLGPLLGFVVGTGLTGAGSGYVFGRRRHRSEQPRAPDRQAIGETD